MVTINSLIRVICLIYKTNYLRNSSLLGTQPHNMSHNKDKRIKCLMWKLFDKRNTLRTRNWLTKRAFTVKIYKLHTIYCRQDYLEITCVLYFPFILFFIFIFLFNIFIYFSIMRFSGGSGFFKRVGGHKLNVSQNLHEMKKFGSIGKGPVTVTNELLR